jgi:hypothetical protein
MMVNLNASAQGCCNELKIEVVQQDSMRPLVVTLHTAWFKKCFAGLALVTFIEVV